MPYHGAGEKRASWKPISICLLIYIQLEVPKITSEKFHYEQFPQKYLNGDDFPIGER